MKTNLFILFAFLTFAATAQPIIQLELFAEGLESPVDITNAGDERLFIVEQDGVIKIIETDGTVLPTPFLDIDARVNSSGNERGLLGLAFHPNYADNGYFYVNYTAAGGTTRISRFSVSATNANIADPNSELILYTVAQPFPNHNAGDLNFGPDGYLYFGLGDGGDAGDPLNTAQDPQNPLGKMMRIDVDTPSNGENYGIPADNPFVNDPSTLDEIWAMGLRNPWRFSFDSETGDMWIADVGQDVWEEIDFQPAASPGGENYGWRCYEGQAPFNTSGCPDESTFTKPIHTYFNSFSVGCSVTGGFVYRGTQHPNMVGHYIFTDFCTGKFWTLLQNGANNWLHAEIGDFADQEYSTLGEDYEGELYVASLAEGDIHRIIEGCSDFSQMPDVQVINETCDFSQDGAIFISNVTGGTPPYTYTMNGESSSASSFGLFAGTYFIVITDANGCTIEFTTFVDFNNPPTPSIFPESGFACYGDTITLTCVPPDGYETYWYSASDGAIGSGSTLDLTGGDIVYTQFSSFGSFCQSEESNDAIFEFYSSPSPSISVIDEVQLTASNGFNYDNSFTWYLDGEPLMNIESCPGIGNDQWCIIAQGEGEYTVCEYDFFTGCSACSAPFSYEIIDIEAPQEIANIDIFPNPVNDILNVNITVNTPTDIDILIQNTQGQVVYENTIFAVGNLNKSLDVRTFPTGVYLLSLRTSSGIITSKVIID